MVEFIIQDIYGKHIDEKYYSLKKVTSKMQKAASSIGFLEQALYYQFTPTFATLKGNFISSIDKKQAEKKVIKKHLFEHRNNLKDLKGRHYKIINELLKLVGKVILRILVIDLCNSLCKSNIFRRVTRNFLGKGSFLGIRALR